MNDLTGRLKQRLEALREEKQAGEARLAELESQAAELRRTLLRIGGAIQVLEETIVDPGEAAAS